MVFGASRPMLPYAVLGVCMICALVATVAGVASFNKRNAPLDVVRLLSISRNTQLDGVFSRYSDYSTPVDEEITERRIGYEWVEEIGSRALVVDSGGDGESLISKHEK